MLANSVSPPSGGTSRAASSEACAGTRLKELSLCHIWLPALKRLRLSPLGINWSSASTLARYEISGAAVARGLYGRPRGAVDFGPPPASYGVRGGQSAEGGTMRYVLLIGSDDKNAPPPTQAQMDGIIQGHMRFGQELHASGKMVVGERLRPDTDASRIRVKAGHRQVMDGPFAETK